MENRKIRFHEIFASTNTCKLSAGTSFNPFALFKKIILKVNDTLTQNLLYDDLHFFYILAYCVLLSTHTYVQIELRELKSVSDRFSISYKESTSIAGWFYIIFLYFVSSPKNIHHSF